MCLRGAKGGTVPSLAETPRVRKGGLGLRIISSVLMLPPMVAAIWLGGAVFAMLIAVMTAVLMWEWHRLLAPRLRPVGWFAIAGTTVCVAASAWNPAFVAGCAAMAVALVALLVRKRRGLDLALLGFGPIYIGLPAVALLLLRGDFGFDATLWLFVAVWATDIGAYAFGRTIGGPKLMPRVSPNKTWAGLLGGMLCAAGVGVAGSGVAELANLSWLALGGLGAGLALTAQLGDLFESAIKRRVGAKDSSNLIPGHGGLLDRVDGVLTAAPAAVAVLMSLRALGALA